MKTFHIIVNDTNFKFSKEKKEYKYERVIWILNRIIFFNAYMFLFDIDKLNN